MSFEESGILVPLRVRNPFTGAAFPRSGELQAVLDTGYSGFLLVPEDQFKDFGLVKSEQGEGILADRRHVRFEGAFATIEFPSQRVAVDGLVQTAPWASEVLLGLDGMRRLFIGIDSCAKNVSIEPC